MIEARFYPEAPFGPYRFMSETDLAGRPTAGLLAAIVESSEDAIISETLGGVVTSWNAAAERIFGYAAAEMIGQPITILATLGSLGEIEYILDAIGRGERLEHYETERRRKDGQVI